MKTNYETWLFNPFKLIAGWSALGLGSFFILLMVVLLSFTPLSLDGVVDVHITGIKPIITHAGMMFINLFSMILFLLISGRVLSGNAFRLIDIVGTQMLAKAPFLLVVITGFFIEPQTGDAILKAAGSGNMNDVFSGKVILLIVVSVVATVWSVILMYRSYSICFHISGTKSVVSFIVCFLLAEVVSKILILSI